MNRARRSPDRDNGYILVAVLGVMLVLTGFMAAGSLLVRSALDTARIGDAQVRESGIARAGLELTAYELFISKAVPGTVDGRRLRITGGSFVARLVDEGGKADLNGSTSNLLGSVFKGAGIDDGMTRNLLSCIVALRGPDKADKQQAVVSSNSLSEPPSAAQNVLPTGDLTGAAQQQVSAQGSASAAAERPRLRGFQSVEQLRDCPDLTSEDYKALAPLLTVYNPGGKISLMTASPAMLYVLPGLSGADVEMILARRNSPDMKTADDLMALMKEAMTYGKTTNGPAYTIQIDAVSDAGHRSAIHVVIASSKSRAEPYYLLDRQD